MFIITNRELFKFNSQVHKLNITSAYDMYYPQTMYICMYIVYPQTNLAQFQKGICYMGVQMFNHLPIEIKSTSNGTKSFKSKLTTFLLQNSFMPLMNIFNRLKIYLY
jgi:hypothetical protein